MHSPDLPTKVFSKPILYAHELLIILKLLLAIHGFCTNG
jgi:hypothetical protein